MEMLLNFHEFKKQIFLNTQNNVPYHGIYGGKIQLNVAFFKKLSVNFCFNSDLIVCIYIVCSTLERS